MMNRSRCSRTTGVLPKSAGARLAVLTVVFVLPSLGLAGQEAQAPEQSPKTAEQVFKNIQALKGLPAAHVAQVSIFKN
jgi:hypothetical protein